MPDTLHRRLLLTRYSRATPASHAGVTRVFFTTSAIIAFGGVCLSIKVRITKERTHKCVLMTFSYSGSSKGSRSVAFSTGLRALGCGNESPSHWRKSPIVRGRSVKFCEASHQFNESRPTKQSPTSVRGPFIPSELRMNSFKGTIAAFLHSSCRSEPEKPSVRAATRSMSTDGDREVLESIYGT